MILLHRLTPGFIFFTLLFGNALYIVKDSSPIWTAGVTLFVVGLLLLRLHEWQLPHRNTWYLAGTPMLFLLSGTGLILFMETVTMQALTAVIMALIVFLFTEFVFQYLHAPVNYQPYSIEYTSAVVHILTVFFLSSVGFGLYMLLQVPLAFLSLIFFLSIGFLISAAFWTSKIDRRETRLFSWMGALLAVELFAGLSFLPTGFYTNAALMTVYFYVFLGLTRAELLHKLSKEVTIRYSVIGLVLILLIGATTQWI